MTKRRTIVCSSRVLVLVAAAVACSCSSGIPRELGRRYIQATDIPGAGYGLPVIVTPEGRRIYVAAQAALDSEGNIVGKGSIIAQTHRAIENLETALAAAQATIDDLVRVDVYLLGTEDPETVRKILAEEFPADRAPNQLILPVPELSPSESLIQISGLAVVASRPDQTGVSYLNPPALANPHGAAAVSVAESRGLVYLSGQSDSSIGKHEPIADMAEITRRCMEGLTIALKAGRTSFSGVVNSVVYMSSLKQLNRVQKVYTSYFPEGKVPPTSYVPRAHSDSPASWLEIDVEAVIPQSAPPPSRNEFINPPGLIKPAIYTQVVRAAPGRTVYISAQTSVESPDVKTQTQAVYERIQHMLHAAGAGWDDVVKVRVFPIAGKGVMGAITAVRAKFYNPDAPPASTLLGWDGLAVPGARLQVDVIAVVPGAEKGSQ